MYRALLLASLLLLPAAAADAPGVSLKWSDFNEYELIGFSGKAVALREHYLPDRGPEGDPVDCGYAGLKGKEVTAFRSAHELIKVPARGLVLHLVPFELEKLSEVRAPHRSFVVYRAVTSKPQCVAERDARRETARAEKAFEAAGIDLDERPAMRQVFRRVDLSSCRDPEHEEGCSQEGQIKLAGKVITLKLRVQTSSGRMDVTGDISTGRKGFRFRFGHSSGNSFTMLPLEIHRQGKLTLLLFQFAEVFTSDRRRTAYFMVF